MPDLRTTAHEAAHVVQQRAGVHLKGGVGETGDAYERNADEVADRVVRGESAADLLPGGGSSPGSAVQRTDAGGAPPAAAAQRSAPELLEEAIHLLETALAVGTGDLDERPSTPAAGATDAEPGGAAAGAGLRPLLPRRRAPRRRPWRTCKGDTPACSRYAERPKPRSVGPSCRS